LNALVTAIEPKGSWFSGQSDRDLLDAFLVQQKAPWEGSRFVALGDAWRECTLLEAQAVIQKVSVGSLAYGGDHLNPWAGSVSPSEFLGRFDESARVYTNMQDAELKSWMPATTATFDAGVGIVDGISLGIIWAQDED
jgi:hypothetical protein